jgi:hypothetical protein
MICRHLAHEPLPSRHSRSDEIIIPRAIVYLSADRAQWKILLEAREACFGITAALLEFTKELERKMGKMAITRIMGDRDRVTKRVGKEWDAWMSRKRTRRRTICRRGRGRRRRLRMRCRRVDWLVEMVGKRLDGLA